MPWGAIPPPPSPGYASTGVRFTVAATARARSAMMPCASPWARAVENNAATLVRPCFIRAWMTKWDDLTDAIPPNYTEHVGGQLMTHLRGAA